MEELCRFVNVSLRRPYYNLERASFVLPKGELIGLSCDTISTKQCLIDLLLKAVEPSAGRILWSNARGRAMRAAEGRLISFECRGLFHDLSVSENLSMSFFRNHVFFSSRRAERLTDQLLRRFHLGIAPSLPVYKLAPLERYMLNMISAANSGAQLLILSDLQKLMENENSEKVQILIDQLIASGITILVTECYHCAGLLGNSTILRFENNQLVHALRGSAELFDFNQYRWGGPAEDLRGADARRNPPADAAEIRIHGIRTRNIRAFDISLKPGEISYLIGKNQYEQEFVDALFGENPDNLIAVGSRMLCSAAPAKLKRYGIGYFPQNIETILFPSLGYIENKSMLVLRHISRLGLVIRKSMQDFLAAPDGGDLKSVMSRHDYQSQLSCCVERYALYRWKLLVLYLPSVLCDQTEVKLLKQLIHSLSEKQCCVLVVVSSASEMITGCDSEIEFDPSGRATKIARA